MALIEERKSKKLGILGIIARDLDWEKEKKNYEKVQRAIEKKDKKKLDRWIRQFAGGKEDWLD